MQHNTVRMSDYIDEIYATESLDERFNIYEKYVQLLGFDSAIYVFSPNIKIGQACLPSIFFCTDRRSNEAIDAYVKGVLDQYSMTVKAFNKPTQVSLQTPSKTVPIFIPLMNNNIGRAGAVILDSKKSTGLNGVADHDLKTLTYFSKLFHDINFTKIQKVALSTSLSFLTELSEKELGILKHLAAGKCFKTIAYSVDVASYKVAANMLDRLREKFGSKITRDQLMYLIGLLDVLSLYDD